MTFPSKWCKTFDSMCAKLVFGLFVFASISVSAIEQPTNAGSIKGKLTARMPLGREGGYVEAREYREEGDYSGERIPTHFTVLAFYKEGQSEPYYVYEAESEGFVGFYLSNAVEVRTLLEGGSTLRLKIFRITPTGVKLVFTWAGKMIPEFVDLDGDGGEEMIIYEEGYFWPDGKFRPDEVVVYRWNNEAMEYEEVARGSWKQRCKLLRRSIQCNEAPRIRRNWENLGLECP